MKNSSNLNISCKVVFSLNKWNKKVGSPSSFGRKRPFISLNSSASIGNLSSSERARARALTTQKMMRRKDVQCNRMESPSDKLGKFSLKIPIEIRILQSYNSFKKLTRDYIQNQV